MMRNPESSMDAHTYAVKTQSPGETEALGKALAQILSPGSVVALRGELASGKTCLVRGMVSHFASDCLVSSPTFTIVNEYGNGPRIYHVDLYRLSHVREVIDLGYEELFDVPDGICVVEWAERAEDLLPPKRLDIILEHAGEDQREITVQNLGLLPKTWKEQLDTALLSVHEAGG